MFLHQWSVQYCMFAYSRCFFKTDFDCVTSKSSQISENKKKFPDLIQVAV